MKVEIDIDIQDIQDTMNDWYGFKLTKKQIKEILQENKWFVADMASCGFDTCCREGMADLICKKVGLTKHWPLGMDSEEYKNTFYKELEEAAQKHGFKWQGME